MFAALLVATLLLQDPTPAGQPAPTATPPAAQAAPLRPISDKDAKTLVDAFARSGKQQLSLADKVRAVEELAKGANKLLVRPLAQVVLFEKSVVVRKRAAELLALQPATDANPAILQLLKNADVIKVPAVAAELLRGLQHTGYQSKQWKDIEPLFEQDYAQEHVPLQESILDLVTVQKEKQAIELLLRNLDEPIPKNVDVLENPPASYWEARWKAWTAWRSKVKDALFTLTGQRFSTAAEAREWLAKNSHK